MSRFIRAPQCEVYLAVALVIFSIGCSTTVNLTVNNPTPQDLQPRVVVKNPNSIVVQQLSLGTVAAKGHSVTRFEVKKGGSFQTLARLPSSAEVFADGARTITSSDPNPLNAQVELKIGPPMLPPDGEISSIADAFSKLGSSIGFDPIPLAAGLKTYFGALIVITPPTAEGTAGKILHVIQPGLFSPLVKLEDFQYPDSLSSQTAKLTGSGSAKLKVSVPIYGSFGLGSANDSAYELQWTMKGFGMVPKPDPADWNYISAFSKLPNEVKIELLHTLQTHPTAVFMYVNKIYVIKSATIHIKEGHKISGQADLNAVSFVTAEGAWTFENAREQSKTFDNSIVNIDGPVFTPQLVKIQPNQVIAMSPSKVKPEDMVSNIVVMSPRALHDSIHAGFDEKKNALFSPFKSLWMGGDAVKPTKYP